MRDSYRQLTIKTTLTILTVISSFVTYAATYYLSPSGSDTSGSGSSSSPWKTINKAWTVAKAGDVIYMKGGTYSYSSTQNLKGKSGSSGYPIKIWAVPGEKPVITPSSSFTGIRGIDIQSNYVHLKGLEVCNYKQRSGSSFIFAVYAANSNNLTFETLKVHDNCFGISISEDSGNNLILNSDCYLHSDPLTNISGMTKYGGSDGITIRSSNPSKTNTISGCRMWWNSDDGVDLFGNNGTIIIENSWAFWNGYIPGTFTTGGDGNGFKLGNTTMDLSTSVRRIIRKNLAFQNRKIGFDQNEARCITQLYNNTSYNNGYLGSSARSFSFAYGSQAHVAKNNIDYKSTMSAYFSTQSSVSYNTFQKTGAVNTAYSVSSSDFLSLDNTGVTGPRQSDGSLPNLNFLKLASTSDLINKGSNVGLAFSGTAPDLGAYEYGSTLKNATIPQDETIPVISEFSIPSQVNSLDIPIATFIATDDVEVTGYLVTETDSVPSVTSSLWQSNAPSVYVANEPGTKTLYAWTKDGDGNLSQAFTSEVSLNVDLTTGIEEDINNDYKIDVYPNPCVDHITVRFSKMPDAGSRIDIFNVAGKRVESREITNPQESISLGNQAPGLYMVKTTVGSRETTTKLILSR